MRKAEMDKKQQALTHLWSREQVTPSLGGQTRVLQEDQIISRSHNLCLRAGNCGQESE